MTDPLSLEQLKLLLPVLQHAAELVVEKRCAPSNEELQLLLKGIGLDKEEWAVGELEHWAKVLAELCGVTDAAKRDIAKHALMQRGVPEEHAQSAVETVAGPAPAQHQSATLPIQVIRKAVGFDELKPGEAIGFGELKPGEGAQTILTVSGGPGRVKVGSDMVMVQPETFGSVGTTLTVAVKGGADGQLLWDALILDSETEKVTVELIAQWRAPTPIETLKRQTLECLRQEPQILDRFIEQQQGRWHYHAWLTLLEELRFAGFEPFDESQVSALLEERWNAWKERTEAERQLLESERQSKIQALFVQAINEQHAGQYEKAIQTWQKVFKIDNASTAAKAGIAHAKAKIELAKLKRTGFLSYFFRKNERFLESITDSLLRDNIREAVDRCEESGGRLADVLKAGLLQYSQARTQARQVTREEIREAMLKTGMLKDSKIDQYVQFLGTILGF